MGITDDFMMDVETKGFSKLVNPRTGQTTGEVYAPGLWDEIVRCAWTTGDPGLVFLDEINKRHWNPHLGQIESTNPCGEQPLLPNESCNLGSLDVYKLLGDQSMTDIEAWDRVLRPVIKTAVRFLDNVITMNAYPDLDVEVATKRTRRIGLGVMGWADLLAIWDIPYDSLTALDLAHNLSTLIVQLTKEYSMKLGKERGAYPECQFYPGYRNTAPNTIAPTGTISIIAGCSSGIEPIYKLAYTRHILDGSRITELHPVFEARGRQEEWLTPANVKRVLRGDTSNIPDHILEVFPVAEEIDPEAHLEMQAAWQGPLDNAVSKTINLPHDASRQEIDRIYRRAYEMRLMGITVYRDQSRPAQVLTTPISADLCPVCFSEMLHKEGCWECPKCLYSVCG